MFDQSQINCQPIDLNNYELNRIIRDDSCNITIEATNVQSSNKFILICTKDQSKNSKIIDLINISNMDIQGLVKIAGYRLPLEDEDENYSEYYHYRINGTKVNLTNFIIIRHSYKYGSLSEAITSQNNFTPTIKSKIIFGIAAIMENIHKNRIVHSNLTSENILLNNKKEPNIFIDDSFRNEDTVDDFQYNYDPIYVAPERMNKSKIDYSADVFSFAIILYQIFDPIVSFDCNTGSVKMRYAKGLRPKRSPKIPQIYWQLIEDCWKQDPDDRPTFNEIVHKMSFDKYALEGTDFNELARYKKQIQEGKLQRLQKRLNLYKSLFTYPKLEKKDLYITNVKDNFNTINRQIFNKSGQLTLEKKLSDIEISIIEQNEDQYLINFPSFIQVFAIKKNPITIYTESHLTTLKDLLEMPILKPTLKVCIVLEIVHAMKYLHSKHFSNDKSPIYKYLNPNNVVFNSVYEAKLENYGYLKSIENSDKDSKDSINPGYYSPEQKNNEELTQASDVYSFGLVVYTLFTKKVLDDEEKFVYKAPANNSNISVECIKMIEKCLKKDSDERITFKEILDYLRKIKYNLLDDFDISVIQRRDNELNNIENIIESKDVAFWEDI